MSDATPRIVHSCRIVRLARPDLHAAKKLFRVMVDVFEEGGGDLSDTYVDALLARDEFWAFAALSGDDIVGGLTAHTLPMTRTESREIFIYDLAVRRDCQRQGIGRLLVQHLREAAAGVGIHEVFVPVDIADLDAREFYRALGGVESPVAFFTFGSSTP